MLILFFKVYRCREGKVVLFENLIIIRGVIFEMVISGRYFGVYVCYMWW